MVGDPLRRIQMVTKTYRVTVHTRQPHSLAEPRQGETSEGLTPISAPPPRDGNGQGLLKSPVDELDSMEDEGQVDEDGEKTLSDRFAEIMAQLPEEGLRNLRVDGSEQHDHYIFGWPKRQR